MFGAYAHIVPHRHGGSREPDNILRLCNAHHTQFDAGVIRLEPRGDDLWEFMAVSGQSLGMWSPDGRSATLPTGDDAQATGVSERLPEWQSPLLAGSYPLRC